MRVLQRIDTASAALLGAIAGYLIHLHWPEIESIFRVLGLN
jgi:hypothetical protein